MTRERAEKVASFCTGFCLSAIYWLGGMGITFRTTLPIHRMFFFTISGLLIVLLSLFFYYLLRFKFYKGWDDLFFNKMCILLSVLILIAIVRRFPSQNTLINWLNYMYFFYCFILFPVEILLINYVFSKSLKPSLAWYGCIGFVCFMSVWSFFLKQENSYFVIKNFWCKFYEISFFVVIYFFYHIKLPWMKVVSIFLMMVFMAFSFSCTTRRQQFLYFCMIELMGFVYLVKFLVRQKVAVVFLCIGLFLTMRNKVKLVVNCFDDRSYRQSCSILLAEKKYFFTKMFGNVSFVGNLHNVFLDVREKVGFVGLLLYCSAFLSCIFFFLQKKNFYKELFILLLGNGILMLGNSCLSRFISLYIFMFFIIKKTFLFV